MAQAEQWTPQVGEGATVTIWTDSYAVTVIAVSKSGKQITIQDDTSRVLSGSAHDGSATYEYLPNPQGRVSKATLRGNGRFRLAGWNSGGSVNPGRRTYQDPSF